MQSQIIQNLRQKLNKRVQRLNTEKINAFLITLQRFWLFFDSQPIYVCIMDALVTQYPDLDNITERIFQGEGLLGESEEEASAIGYSVLRRLSNPTYAPQISRIGQILGGHADSDNIPAIIRSNFLDPFYEYIDEQLDDQKLILIFLIRYKYRTEWFHRDQLLNLTKSDSRKAEKSLALNFYSYLHDQGLDFTIEPSSISGEIDLIAAQGTEDPLLADAKIFDGNARGKRYIRKAFNQIYTYTQQYNEPFGYLVIFKVTDKDLCFALSNKTSNVPVVTYNHKSIFLITIDIHENPKPVSQRNPLNAVIISEEELIQPVKNRDITSDVDEV
ncbi:hypothetical protein [Allocoleopsis franciscana]|uniref:Uncharacterized protein n=1 Tax=Allocoleopsis franciscana PCC 7113 TaxID=1173027 RepID=K9WB14_9CYAN|nr:hypothetical protein [Allocoleopsis franciscana]AFZ16697.1 hypothetical protein Mic7113_0788 [Allocoleopsis franciscana PCC 7113]